MSDAARVRERRQLRERKIGRHSPSVIPSPTQRLARAVADDALRRPRRIRPRPTQ